MNGSSGHFIGEGFSGVCRVGLTAIGGLEDEFVGRKFVRFDDASDDGEVAFNLRFQKCCDSGGEDVFRTLCGGGLVDFGCVGIDDSLVFSGDGFTERSSDGFLCLCLRHDLMVGGGGGRLRKEREILIR